MLLELAQKMTMLAQLETTISTAAGGLFPDRTAASTIVTAVCYCFYNEENRSQTTQQVETGVRKWCAILPSSFSPFVAVGSVFQNVTDRFGNRVMYPDPQVIEECIFFNHWNDGQQFIELVLRPN